MKIIIALALTVSLLAALPGRAEDPHPGKPHAADSPLEPMAFLVGGEWEAKLPVGQGEKRVSILAHFTWANNRQAIRISNNYAMGGKTAPYIDGFYAWHPLKRTIVFQYVDGQGNFYEGTVKPETNGLTHEFNLTNAKGEVSQFTSRQTYEGTNAWINEIFSRKDGHLEPEVKVRYEKVK